MLSRMTQSSYIKNVMIGWITLTGLSLCAFKAMASPNPTVTYAPFMDLTVSTTNQTQDNNEITRAFHKTFPHFSSPMSQEQIDEIRAITLMHFPDLAEETLFNREVFYLYYYIQKFQQLSTSDLNNRLLSLKLSDVFPSSENTALLFHDGNLGVIPGFKKLFNNSQEYMKKFIKHVHKEDIDKGFFDIEHNNLLQLDYKTILGVFFGGVLHFDEDLPEELRNKIPASWQNNSDGLYSDTQMYLTQDLYYYLTYVFLYTQIAGDYYKFPETMSLQQLLLVADILHTYLPIHFLNYIQYTTYTCSGCKITQKQALKIYEQLGDFLLHRRKSQHSHDGYLPLQRLFSNTNMAYSMAKINIADQPAYLHLFLAKVLGLQDIELAKLAQLYPTISEDDMSQILKSMTHTLIVNNSPFP